MAEHKSDKMSNQKKGKKGVVQGVTKQINRKITTNKQKNYKTKKNLQQQK